MRDDHCDSAVLTSSSSRRAIAREVMGALGRTNPRGVVTAGTAAVAVEAAAAGTAAVAAVVPGVDGDSCCCCSCCCFRTLVVVDGKSVRNP